MSAYMKLTGICVGFCACHCFNAVCRAGEADAARKLMGQAEAAIAGFDNANVTTHVRYEGIQEGQPPARSDIQVRQYFSKDGKARVNMRIVPFDGAGKARPPTERDYILAGDRHALFFPTLSPPKILLSRTASDVDKWARLIHCDPMAACFLEGRITAGDVGNVSIFDLARKGIYRDVKSVALDGIECKLVESETADGLFRVWIAPAKGHGITRFEYHQVRAGSLCKEFTATFDHAGFADVNGRTVLMSGHYVSTFIPVDGTQYAKFSETADAEHADVDFSPSFANANLFTLADLPNGSTVTFDDDRSSTVQYVWQDGAAVPLVDSNLLVGLRAQAEAYRLSHETQTLISASAPTAVGPSGSAPTGSKAPSVPRYVIVPLLAAMVVTGVGAVVWRRRNS